MIEKIRGHKLTNGQAFIVLQNLRNFLDAVEFSNSIEEQLLKGFEKS